MKKKIYGKKGIMLLYAFVIVSFLVILLTASISQMQNSVFLTNRVEAETKAYWASMAGMEYMEARFSNNICFPSAIGSTSTSIGGFTVTETVDIDKNIVHGVLEGTRSEFCIVFNKTPAANSFIPTNKVSVSGKEVSIYSYNGAGHLENEKNKPKRIAGSKITCQRSLNDHKVYFPANSSLYIGVEGRNGSYISNTEKIYQVLNVPPNTYGSSIFVNNFQGNLSGQLIVNQTGGRRPSIVAKGSFSLDGLGTLGRNSGPLKMQNGAIFTNAPHASINGVNIATGSATSEFDYGLRVEPAGDIQPKDFPLPDLGNEAIPSGNYTFVERPANQIDPYLEILQQTSSSAIIQGLIAEMKAEINSNKPSLENIKDRNYDFVFFNRNMTKDDISQLDINAYQTARVLMELDYRLKDVSKDNIESYNSSISRAKGYYAKSEYYEDWTPTPDEDEAPDPDPLGYSQKQNLVLWECRERIEQEEPSYKGRFIPLSVQPGGGIPPKNEWNKLEFVPKESNTLFYAEVGVLEKHPKHFFTFSGDLYKFPFVIDPAKLKITLKEGVNVRVVGELFEFATYETPNYAGGTKYHIASQARATFSPGGNRFTSSQDINIKGCLSGEGIIRAKNIKIEAGGDLAADAGNKIALYADDNIELVYDSAYMANYTQGNAIDEEIVKRNLGSNVSYETAMSLVYENPAAEPSERILTDLGKTLVGCGASDTIENQNSAVSRIVGYTSQTGTPEEIAAARAAFLPASNLRGIIYSNGSISITPGSGKDVSFEGTIYARDLLRISSVRNVFITFDPEYAQNVKGIVPPNSADSRTLSEIFYNMF